MKTMSVQPSDTLSSIIEAVLWTFGNLSIYFSAEKWVLGGGPQFLYKN